MLDMKYEIVNLIYLFKNVDQWLTYLNTGTKLRVP